MTTKTGPARPAQLERELVAWELNNGLRLRVLLLHHRGRRYLDVRRWFLADDGTLRPTKAGVRLDEELAGPLAELLRQVEEGQFDD